MSGRSVNIEFMDGRKETIDIERFNVDFKDGWVFIIDPEREPKIKSIGYPNHQIKKVTVMYTET